MSHMPVQALGLLMGVRAFTGMFRRGCIRARLVYQHASYAAFSMPWPSG